MQFWPSTRWSFSSNQQPADTWTELPLPFALIGSHDRCQIQLQYKRLPPVVYFAVICGSKIEAWPLCGIAFPIWGRVRPSTQLMIGKKKLKLIGEDAPNWPTAAGTLPGDSINDVSPLSVEAESPDASLILDWGAGPQTRKLNRRVSILGEDHPSTIRMHGLGLRECELGIICVGTRIWAVQLNPDAVRDDQPLVQELVEGGESIWVGDVHIWANEPGRMASERFGNYQPQPTDQQSGAAHGMDVALTLAPMSSRGADREVSGQPSQRTLQSSPMLSIGDSEHTQAVSTAADPGLSGLAIEGLAIEVGELRQMPNRGGTPNANEPADHWEESRFTDRILAKAGRRASRKTMLKWSIAAAMVLAAIVIVGAILVRGVLPIVQSIYSE